MMKFYQCVYEIEYMEDYYFEISKSGTLNLIKNVSLDGLFSNVSIVIRLLHQPVMISQGKRIFSIMKRIKSTSYSTMNQERLSILAI